MTQRFNHVVIIGCGLLGTSLGLALRRHQLARTITGVGRTNSASVETARRRGAIDRTSEDPAAAVADADLVIACTPVRQFPDLFRTIAPVLAKGALVSDVGSTKSQVMQWAAELLPAHVTFVGSHPMAGSEKTGPEAARDNLYENAICLVCPPEKNPGAPAVARISDLWQVIGMRVITCPPAQHDRWVAAVSHLPHALAFSLMNAAGTDPAALSAAAGGFADMTRIAGSDPAMWTDIFLTNRVAILQEFETFASHFAALKAAIEQSDEQALKKIVLDSKHLRELFIQTRTSSLKA